MHIPETMLQGTICPVTAILAVVGVGGAAYWASRSNPRPSPGFFSVVAALVFALQMMNFPIQDGTSGHLLGGVLASALLGVPFGVLAIALVVSIQALVFSDGGLTVLGANVFNMACVGAGVGGWMFHQLRARLKNSAVGGAVALAVSAWASVVLAALVLSLELAVDGQIAAASVVPAMVGTHALIGLGEAVITLAFVQALELPMLRASAASRTWLAGLASVVIALLLSPFASGFPDGLEWVAEKVQLLHESAPAFVAPMPDYTFPWASVEAVSLAGLSGVGITFLLAWGVAAAVGLRSSGAPLRAISPR